MVRRLTGFNPLSYLGVDPETPAPMIQDDRSPTTNDVNFVIGTFWVVKTVTPTYELWILMNLAGGTATWVQLYPGAGGGATDFPTDSGTAVEAGGILNVLGGTGIATSGAGNTVTIASDGSLADSFPTDSGTATPMAGVLNVLGGTGCATSGAGNTITIDLNAAVAENYATDAGTATPAAGILNVLGGTGCATTGAGNTVTVNLDATVATTYTADAGSATPAANNLNVLGGTGCSTSGAGSTLTVNLDASVPLTFTADSGSATPAANNLNIVGDGASVSTLGAGSTITIQAIGTGLVDTLTGNSGGAVPPTAGNINVVGDGTTIDVVGNPGTSTLTISFIGSTASIFCNNTQLNQTGGIRYVSLEGNTLETTVGAAQTVIPQNGTIDRLYVNVITAGSTTNSSVTLNKNGVDTALSITITALTTGVYSDLVNSISVAQGDLIAWKFSQATTSQNQGRISCRFIPS